MISFRLTGQTWQINSDGKWRVMLHKGKRVGRKRQAPYFRGGEKTRNAWRSLIDDLAAHEAAYFKADFYGVRYWSKGQKIARPGRRVDKWLAAQLDAAKTARPTKVEGAALQETPPPTPGYEDQRMRENLKTE